MIILITHKCKIKVNNNGATGEIIVILLKKTEKL